MTTNDDLAKLYGQGATLRSRFLFLFFGIAGFLFPGWAVCEVMRIFKFCGKDEDFKYMLNLTLIDDINTNS